MAVWYGILWYGKIMPGRVMSVEQGKRGMKGKEGDSMVRKSMVGLGQRQSNIKAR